MGKALYFSTSMHFMVSKSSAECTAVTKLRVRIEMADNFTCNVEFQFAQPAAAYEPEGRERGEENFTTGHCTGMQYWRERPGKGRGDKVMLIRCQHCMGERSQKMILT